MCTGPHAQHCLLARVAARAAAVLRGDLRTKHRVVCLMVRPQRAIPHADRSRIPAGVRHGGRGRWLGRCQRLRVSASRPAVGPTRRWLKSIESKVKNVHRSQLTRDTRHESKTKKNPKLKAKSEEKNKNKKTEEDARDRNLGPNQSPTRERSRHTALHRKNTQIQQNSKGTCTPSNARAERCSQEPCLQAKALHRVPRLTHDHETGPTRAFCTRLPMRRCCPHSSAAAAAAAAASASMAAWRRTALRSSLASRSARQLAR